jgi:hydrogenase nickel incorporation protein HypA/HybF
MNELAIAMNLVELACAELPHFGAGARITDLRIRLGPRAGLVPETLLLSFTHAAEGSPIEGARLDIDEEPLELRCETCETRVLPNGLSARCLVCGAPAPPMGQGDSLQLVAMSVAGPVARVAAGH